MKIWCNLLSLSFLLFYYSLHLLIFVSPLNKFRTNVIFLRKIYLYSYIHIKTTHTGLLFIVTNYVWEEKERDFSSLMLVYFEVFLLSSFSSSKVMLLYRIVVLPKNLLSFFSIIYFFSYFLSDSILEINKKLKVLH